MKKKFLSIISVLIIQICAVFALPGFNSYIPDIAGEYVFYKDYTFARESYVGILSYDDSTFQIKYYAPISKTLLMPEKEVAILFTVNPESDFMDMTGEKIITDVDLGTEDVDILNYLHDILYEFSARRIKIDELGSEPYASTQDYEQFGGKVTINFDSLIPLFNIKSIKSADGSQTLLNCITFGRIYDENDTSFDDFKGIPQAQPYHAPTVKKVRGKAKKFTTTDNQTITLDTNWEQALDNCWTFGNEGFLTIASVPQYFVEEDINDIFVLRRIIESTDNSYTNFENIEIIRDTKNHITKITSYSYQPENENEKIIYTIKEITNDYSKEYNSYVSLAAYENSYLQKSNYYNKILKTFKSK